MSFEDLVQWLDRYPLWVAGFLVLPPAACGLLRLIHKACCGDQSPWKYAYSVAVYWICVPGLFAAMLTAYLLFFQIRGVRENSPQYLLCILCLLWLDPFRCT